MNRVNDDIHIRRKQELRDWCKQKRRLMTTEERLMESRVVCNSAWERMCNWQVEKKRPLHVFAYMPYGAELDIMPLMLQLRDAGNHIYIPRTIRDEYRLEWYAWHEDLPMTKGVFGIQEPAAAAVPISEELLEQADLILVPGLAFDRNGGRLGMGAGYYDRFLARWHDHESVTTTSPTLWSLIYSWQLVEEIPIESHDHPVDVIVSGHALIHTSSRE